jgi:hypothetical protein
MPRLAFNRKDTAKVWDGESIGGMPRVAAGFDDPA